MSSLEMDPNDRYRQRREEKRKRIRRRRLTAIAVLVGIVVLASLLGFVVAGKGSGHKGIEGVSTTKTTKPQGAKPKQRPLPAEIRGVHVTMALASLKGKLGDYYAMTDHGLNTLELDVKDENGEIGFIPSSVPLARAIGAAKAYYRPRTVACQAHAHGLYLIGRIVTFEDPVLSEKRPGLAVRTADGSLWHNNAGLGWSNPYDRRVWDYNVDIAEAAVRAGFDEIQFDYVRFPSDGDITIIRYPGKHQQPMGWTIPAFVQYAAKRLHPLGARVSVDMFGLAASHNLGIGQFPNRVSRYVDAVYPMVYPSHYHPGEFNLPDPNAVPGTTVALSLQDYRQALRRRKALLIPWLQDFTLGRTYTLADVQNQIASARRARSAGFMLWNPVGLYTEEALAPAAS
jgi:hypothetical protein